MASSRLSSEKFGNASKKYWVYGAIITAILGTIALDTTVIGIGSEDDARLLAFAPDAYGQTEFPRIRSIVNDRAPEASVLAVALNEDKTAAIEKFATIAGAFPVLPVRFTGTMGDGSSGVFDIVVRNLAEGVTVRVQSGPAINGTELRDIPGDIEFGSFTNQIEYQDAGAGINRAMSAVILADLDRETLTGKIVSIVGVFTLINPKSWLVTPVEFNIQ